jgi:hypothetical protein
VCDEEEKQQKKRGRREWQRKKGIIFHFGMDWSLIGNYKLQFSIVNVSSWLWILFKGTSSTSLFFSLSKKVSAFRYAEFNYLFNRSLKLYIVSYCWAIQRPPACCIARRHGIANGWHV